MSQTVDIPDALKKELRSFRFKFSNKSAAFVVKINKSTCSMEKDGDIYEDLSLEELAEELPENQPRYIVLSYERTFDDGRINYPLVLINWSPNGAEAKSLMLHASALINFQNTVDIQKVLEVRDGIDGLTTEAIEAKLK